MSGTEGENSKAERSSDHLSQLYKPSETIIKMYSCKSMLFITPPIIRVMNKDWQQKQPCCFSTINPKFTC